MIQMKLLELHHLNTSDLWLPVFVCDTCGEYIEDPTMGIALYDYRDESEAGVSTEVKTVHKGRCDDRSLPLSRELVEVANQL